MSPKGTESLQIELNVPVADLANQEDLHILPAWIRQFYEAKTNGLPSVAIWGTGKPRREFLQVNQHSPAESERSSQDGSYLSELLLGKGYEVHRVVRRSSTFNIELARSEALQIGIQKS